MGTETRDVGFLHLGAYAGFKGILRQLQQRSVDQITQRFSQEDAQVEVSTRVFPACLSTFCYGRRKVDIEARRNELYARVTVFRDSGIVPFFEGYSLDFRIHHYDKENPLHIVAKEELGRVLTFWEKDLNQGCQWGFGENFKWDKLFSLRDLRGRVDALNLSGYTPAEFSW